MNEDRVGPCSNEEQGDEYLDVTQVLQGEIRIECSILRKNSAADMYIWPSSAHSKKFRLGVVRGKFVRKLTLCSTEKGFEEACERLRKALEKLSDGMRAPRKYRL